MSRQFPECAPRYPNHCHPRAGGDPFNDGKKDYVNHQVHTFRKPTSKVPLETWVPACAGMTREGGADVGGNIYVVPT